MCEQIRVARGEHKTSTELKGILAELLLTGAPRLGSFPGRTVLRSKDVQQVRRLQPCGLICEALFVYQQRKSDAGVLAEHASVVAVSQSDGRQVRAFLVKLVFVLAQLRGVLAAENSTVVAKENDYGRLFLPERPERNLIAVAIG